MRVILFVARRLVRLAVSLVIVSLLTFVALQLAPGDFVSIQSIGQGSVGLAEIQTVETTEQMTARYGPEVPAWKQYVIFMAGAVTGDMGPSYKYPDLTIEQIISTAFPISATLALLATALAVGISVPLGMLAAVRRRSAWDVGTMFVVTLGHGLPNYIAGLALVLLFSAILKWLPPYGWHGPENLIMPVISLAVAPVAVLSRYVRSSVLETLREEYVIAARSKGARNRVGRDVLSRMIYSMRTALFISVSAELLSLLIALVVGLTAGYLGGRTDQVLMAGTDIMYAFPSYLFAVLMVAIIGRSAGAVIIALTIASWVGQSRLMRAQIMRLKTFEYVEAGRAMGATGTTLVVRYMLPNALGPVLVTTSFGIPANMLAESGLALLGLGVAPPTPSVGSMIIDGYQYVMTAPSLIFWPVALFVVTMLAFTWIGDGVRDAFDVDET